MRRNLSKWTALSALFFVLVLACLTSWLAAQESESPLKTTLYFPQWADGGGFSSNIQITNLLKTHGGEVVVRFFSQGEEVNIETSQGLSPVKLQLSPASTLSLTTRGNRDDPLITGWCLVKAQVRIGGKLVYHYPYGQTTVVASPTWRAFTVFVEYERGVRNTGIALANPNENSTSVSFRLIDAAGAAVGAPQTLTFAPHAHRAAFIQELFRDLESQADFQGTVEIVSQRNIIALSLGYSSFPEGRYLIDHSPPQPTRYQNVEAIRKHVVQAVYFVPRDVTVDPDYEAGIRFIAESTLYWYDIELARGGGIGGLSPLINFVRDEETLVDVDLLIGQETSAFYEGEFSRLRRTPTMEREIYQRIQGLAFVIHQANLHSDWGFAYAPGLMAISKGPIKFLGLENNFATYTEDYLLGLYGGLSRYDMARADVFVVTNTATHELGHMVGLPHSELLEAAFQQYRNLMNCCTGSGPGWGIGFWAATLMPDIPTAGMSMQNTALDAGEIAQFVSLWPR